MQPIINAVIIDDLETDIFAIAKCLGGMGISTIPVHYTAPQTAYAACELASGGFPRVIITDIQMNRADVPATNYANVAKCIQSLVAKSEGPYIVLAWTTEVAIFEDLKTYVEKIFKKEGIRLPTYFGAISKTECRPNGTEFDGPLILSKFNGHLDGQKELRALLHWEVAVFRAGLETVNTVIASNSEDLHGTLCALGELVMGKHLEGNEPAALNEAFSYVLRDKIGRYNETPEAQKVWQEALTPIKLEIAPEAKPKLNTILHIDAQPSEALVYPGDVWKIDSPETFFKFAFKSDECADMLNKLREDFVGVSADCAKLNNEIMTMEKGTEKTTAKARMAAECTVPKKAAIEQSIPVVMEISPLCDFAEKKKLLKTLAIGFLVPKELLGSGAELKKSESHFGMPILYDGKVYQLHMSSKYMFSFSDKFLKHADSGLSRLFRVRETMLQSWIHKIASHNSRIGTVSFG